MGALASHDQRAADAPGVANGRDDVQGEARGDSAAIDAFVKDLHRGPSMSQVSDVKLSRDEAAEAKRGGEFEVRASIR